MGAILVLLIYIKIVTLKKYLLCTEPHVKLDMHFITSSSKQLDEVDYHPLFTDEESKAQTEEVTAKMWVWLWNTSS